MRKIDDYAGVMLPCKEAYTGGPTLAAIKNGFLSSIRPELRPFAVVIHELLQRVEDLEGKLADDGK